MASAAHHHNQLLFNLGVPAAPTNMTSKFRNRPEPLIMEKFGPTLTPVAAPLSGSGSAHAFQFSAVSQDRMSVALQLARRDLRHKKLSESLLSEEQQVKPKTNVKTNSRTSKKSTKASGMGRTHARDTKSATAAVGSRWANPRSMVLHVGSSPLPATGMSPPTRDTDPDPHLLPRNPQDERALSEIKHLRSEINACLEHVLKIEETAQSGGAVAKRRLPGEDDLAEAEISRRRAHRASEQASRSARLVYTLQTQTKAIQQEIDGLRPGVVAPGKKTQLLTRLAAAHRGAIRALQSFVLQLEDHDWSQGLPRTHQELTLLVRQLALCCAQLEVAGQNRVPDSVKSLIRDMADYNLALEKEFHASPPRCTKPGVSVIRQQQMSPSAARQLSPHRDASPGAQRHEPPASAETARSPVSRRLFTEDGPGAVLLTVKHDERKTRQEKRQPVRKEFVKGEAARGDEDKENVGVGVRFSKSTKLDHSSDRRRTVRSSPEREAALRQGIAALIRAAESPKRNSRKQDVRPKSKPRATRHAVSARHGHAAYRKHVDRMRIGNRGVLLPAELQAQRGAASWWTRNQANGKGRDPPLPQEDHFARPTVSSRLKEMSPEDRSPHGSPRRSSSSPPRFGFPSPRVPRPRAARSLSPRSSPRSSPGHTSSSPRKPSPRTSPRHSPGRLPFAEREIQRQIQLDREATMKRQQLEFYQSKEMEKVERLRRELGAPESWVMDAEKRIRERLQPILDRAQVELSAEVLSDLIQDELTRDAENATFNESDVNERAAHMQQAPSLEVIMQRLQEMEEEQVEIRRRYATISYDDPLPGATPRRTVHFDTDGQEQPGTPPPIQIDRTSRPSRLDSFLAGFRNTLRPTEDAGAILFTKPQHQTSSFHMTQRRRAPPSGADHRVRIGLSDDLLSSIHGNRERFAKFLKRTSTQAVGRFDPWMVVEQVSDEILEECLHDVATELDEINTDIAAHVYSAEFREVKPDVTDDAQIVPGEQTPET